MRRTLPLASRSQRGNQNVQLFSHHRPFKIASEPNTNRATNEEHSSETKNIPWQNSGQNTYRSMRGRPPAAPGDPTWGSPVHSEQIESGLKLPWVGEFVAKRLSKAHLDIDLGGIGGRRLVRVLSKRIQRQRVRNQERSRGTRDASQAKNILRNHRTFRRTQCFLSSAPGCLPGQGRSRARAAHRRTAP